LTKKSSSWCALQFVSANVFPAIHARAELVIVERNGLSIEQKKSTAIAALFHLSIERLRNEGDASAT
jgi:hypothetical protein